MEPVKAITLSLALGAAEAGKAVAGESVKDAYSKLKGVIKKRYAEFSIEKLEEAPHSEFRRAILEEDLANSDVLQDAELLAAARDLTKLIHQQAPDLAAAIGVDLRDVEAANLRLADIISSGTGVKLGGIDIRGVRAPGGGHGSGGGRDE
jgi:hypothetical protein